MDGRADARIGSAAADIARHGRIDIRIARVAIAFEQRGRTHDLPTLAIAALRHIVANPRILDSLSHLVGSLCFDGVDFLPLRRRYGRNARTDGLAIQMHGARTAHGHAATKFGSGHTQRVAQGPENGR